MGIIISDSLIHFPELESVVATLGDLADDAGGLPGDDAEAGDDHVGRHNGAVKDAAIILDDGKLTDSNPLADVHVVSYAGGLNDRALADEDVIAHPEGHVGESAGNGISILS